MCSYNKVNGVPTCADPKLLKLSGELYNEVRGNPNILSGMGE
jgi:hypothetical protein